MKQVPKKERNLQCGSMRLSLFAKVVVLLGMLLLRLVAVQRRIQAYGLGYQFVFLQFLFCELLWVPLTSFLT